MPRKKKEAVITAFKGFEPDFKCKDFQYEVGKEYETKGQINCCNNGFHACKVPLDVFKYYAPVNNNAELIYSAKVGGKILNKKIKSNVWYWFENGELKERED